MKKSKLRQIIREEIRKRLAEASPGEEAKKRGLKHIGFGRYVDPSEPSKVVAKSEKGKLVAVGGKRAKAPAVKKGKAAGADLFGEKPSRKQKSAKKKNKISHDLVGKRVATIDGPGEVILVPNSLSSVTVELDNGKIERYTADDFGIMKRQPKLERIQQALKDVTKKAEEYEGEFAGGDAKSGFVFLFPDKDTAELFQGAETPFDEPEKAPEMWPVKHKGQTGFAVKILGKHMQPTIEQ